MVFAGRLRYILEQYGFPKIKKNERNEMKMISEKRGRTICLSEISVLTNVVT